MSIKPTTATELLKLSENLLFATFDKASVGIANVKPNGQWLRVNLRLCQILGYSAEELKKLSIHNIIHPADLSSLLDLLQNMLHRSTDTQALEQRYIDKNGNIVWVKVTISLPRNSNNGANYFVFIIEDIGERKQIQKALMQSENKFHALYLAMNEGVALHEIIYDDKGQAIDYRILEVNPAYTKILGIAKSDATGQLASQVYRSEKPPYLDLYLQVVTNGESIYFETDYSPMEKSFSISVFSPAEHQFATVFSDITKRKQTEQNLIDALDELDRESSIVKSLIQNIPDLIWLKDPEGRYLSCNSKFESFFGASEQAIKGKTDYDFVDKNLADFFRKNDLKAMENNGISINEEWITFARTGEKVLLETSKVPLTDRHGENIGVLGIGHDITERKLHEESLQQSEAALKEAQRLANIGNWEFDLISQKLIWSEQVYRIFEVDQMSAKTSYKNHLKAIHPADRAAVKDAFKHALRVKQPFQIRHRLSLDGKIKHVEQQGLIEFDDNGRAIKLVGTIQDITERVKSETQLERLNHFINQSSDSVFIIDAATARIVDANGTACSTLGYRLDEITQLHVWNINNTLSGLADWKKWLPDLMKHQGEVFETKHRCRNGNIISVEINARYVEEADGNFFIAIVRDISERKKSEQLILESSQRYQAVLSSTKDGFWLTDILGVILDVNDAYCSYSGYTRQELRGMKISQLDFNESESDVAGRIQQLIKDGSSIFETMHQRKDGSTWPVEISISYSDIQQGQFFVFLRDISERKQAEKQIQYMAYNDLLTGLPNRELLADRLDQAISQALRTDKLLAICYIDLDGFKPINDRFGHATGDRLLLQFARRIKQSLRKGDTIARLGGDEFTLILSNLESIYQGEEIVHRTLESIAQPFEIDGFRIHISASIGVTFFPNDQSDPDTLLRHADQAMYLAKESGKNTFRLFNPIQNQKLQAHRAAIDEFSAALNLSQLALFYQPRIDLANGSLISVEALIRWQHSEKGLLLPAQFLPLIEGTPQEIALDEWVIKTALDQHMSWRAQGLILPVSVNLSPRHVQLTTFPEFLKTLLSSYPEDIAQFLELEVLETSAIGNTTRVAELMHACTRLGVKFSLDDFGTGYSSLTYFSRLPIHILKIDQHFVRDMLVNSQDQDIVEGVLRLAQALKRPVVAEGVESIELAMMLLQLGCQFAQGYGIAKPMPAQQLLLWITSWEENENWHKLSSEIKNLTEFYDLNVAIFTLRRWINQLAKYMESGCTEDKPVMDDKHCLFNLWYQGIGQIRYGDHSQFEYIREKHFAVHNLGRELINLFDKQQIASACNKLTEINQIGDDLVSLLTQLSVIEDQST